MDYSYTTSYSSGQGGDVASAIFAGCYALFWLAIAILIIVAMWRIFTKAGKPGWAAIIPIYDVIVLLEIVGRPLWWVILYFIPLVNIVIGLIVLVDLAKAFGKGTGFALGLIFLSPIFMPILGFGKAQYVGPVAAAPPAQYPPQPPAGGYYPPQSPQPPQPYAPPAPPVYQPPAYPPQPYAPPAPPVYQPPVYPPPAPPAAPPAAPPVAPPVAPSPAPEPPAPPEPPASPEPPAPPEPPAAAPTE